MEFKRILQKRSKGFSLIEMIAALVLVSILVPGISLIVRGTMMNIAFTNMAVFANMEADYAQRSFIKHINGVKSFSQGNLTVDNLRFTSYGVEREDGNLVNVDYEYEFDDSRKINYTIIGAPDVTGILLKNVVNDTTINAVNYVSKFTYRGKDNTDLGGTPTATDVYGVELTFYLLRGESFYKYTTYATIDKDQLSSGSTRY
jgi:prepilin-type N-terminal cleavage/methylation domain-containing protein